MIGQTLGHYHIESKLGEGGMGVVYRAHDETLDRDVALKVLSPETLGDEAARARFRKEALALSRLNHPNICTIYEVGEAAGQAFLAMEYVEGRPLRAVSSEGALSIETVLRYGFQMADALAHAHARGVVHRDMKSANVMVTPEGRIKVLDFGLARRMSQAEAEEATRSQFTEAGTVVGTLHYMPPEVFRGETADARSDLWALGVVLHEMAAGELPFQGRTGFEVSGAILNQPPGPLPAGVPAGLQSVIGRCLAKAPGERYQRAEEIRASLETLQSGGRVAAPLLTRRRLLVAAGALALVLLTVLGVGLWRIARGPRLNSIAVLPLRNLSGDPQQEYFSDGITEALINDLAKIRALKVISRTSAMRYKATDKPLREIARELNVEAVLEGSALRVGDRVRITAQLIDARTEQNLWAESYERDLRDVLTLQGEVARAIAGQIRVAVTPEETKRLARARSVNPEAYEAYLKGRVHSYITTPEDSDTAMRYFRLALEKDPNYALAHAGISYVWGVRAHVGFVAAGDGWPKAKAAATKALELDDTLAEAHDSLALVAYLYEWDWPGAEREIRRAIEINPNYAHVRAIYAEFLGVLRRWDEMTVQAQRYLELDPHNSFFQALYGMQLLLQRRFDEGIAQLQKVLRTEPNSFVAHANLWQAFHRKGMYDQALAEAKKTLVPLGQSEGAEALERGYALGGYRAAMRLAAEKLATRPFPPAMVANFYTFAGENDLALKWLEKGYQERDSGMVYLNADPTWDDLRSEPRFQDLLRRMKFRAN